MSPTVPGRPLRRDAAINRDRLLAAASDLFDSEGLDASVADIAGAAGVGMGTLYRHFPTKEAIIEALVRKVLDATIAMATDAATAPGGTGLERFLEGVGAFQAQHPGCLPRLWNTDDELVRAARRLIAGLLADAQAHGQIRPDVTSSDISMVLLSVRGVLEATYAHAPDGWRRHLEILLAGLRPGGAALVHPPLSPAEHDRVLASPPHS